MPEERKQHTSKYMLKVIGKRTTFSNTRPRRICERCKRPLKGKRGHGFPTIPHGKTVTCGGCRRA